MTFDAYSVPSKSKPGESHTVRFDDAGDADCDCDGFMYRKDCSHVQQAKEYRMSDRPPIDWGKLRRPLDPSRVSTRRQAGVDIAYLEGHDVVRTANEVFGEGNWGYEVHGVPIVVEEGTWGERQTPYRVWAVSATVTVAGCQPITEVGTNAQNGLGASAVEMAVKGAATDAVKRCLKNFGDQFGLILYDKGTSPEEVSGRWQEYRGEEAPANRISQAELEARLDERPRGLLSQLSTAFDTLNIDDPIEKLEAIAWFTGRGPATITLPTGKMASTKVQTAFTDWAASRNVPESDIIGVFLKAMQERQAGNAQ